MMILKNRSGYYLESQNAITPPMEERYKEIQEYIVNNISSAVYLLQRRERLIFNRDYIDQDSVGDLENMLGDFYVFYIRFTPPPCAPIFGWSCAQRTIFLVSFGSGWMLLVGGVFSIVILKKQKTRI